MDHTEYSAECFKMTIQSALYAGFLALGRVLLCMLYLKKGTEYSVRGLPNIIQITLLAMNWIPHKYSVCKVSDSIQSTVATTA